VPFITRTGDVLVEGYIDRLVLTRENGRVVGAAVIDYKTDAVSSAAEVQQRAEHYGPQIEAYRRAVCGMYGLAGDAVEGWLVFVEAGRIVRVGDGAHRGRAAAIDVSVRDAGPRQWPVYAAPRQRRWSHVRRAPARARPARSS
jgi:hypothetical protein